MKSCIWLKTGLVIVAAGTIMTLSCSKKPENPAWFQSTSTGKYLDQTVLLDQIAQTDDIFTLYRMKDEYRRRGGKSPVVEHALGKKWKELLGKNPPLGEICPEADLIAFDFKQIGPGQHRADFIFRTKQAFDQDYWISLKGAVDGENLSFISESRRKAGRESEQWDFPPHPPASAWPVGEYVLISKVLSAPPIPYKMSAFLYNRSVKSGLHGSKVQLGWRTATTESGLLSLIESSDNLISLFRLKTENQDWVKKSEVIRKAFEKKSRQLLKGQKPLGSISPEADLFAFDYKKVGENQYRVAYLFKVNQQFDRDYSIALYGIVDKSNIDFLSEVRRKAGKKSEVWTFLPDLPTSHWQVGEYILVSKLIHAQPIPYKMHTILYDPGKKSGLHGQPVDLGWRVDLVE